MEDPLDSDVELVKVMVTDDMGRYLFAKSLLNRDSIEYVLKGDVLRMSHGWTQTRLTDTPLEPVEFWVRSEDANRARSVLRELETEVPRADDFDGEAEVRDRWRRTDRNDRFGSRRQDSRLAQENLRPRPLA